MRRAESGEIVYDHKQVNYEGRSYQVDELMVPLLRAIHRKGIITYYSCQGTVGVKHGYVFMDNNHGAAQWLMSGKSPDSFFGAADYTYRDYDSDLNVRKDTGADFVFEYVANDLFGRGNTLTVRFKADRLFELLDYVNRLEV